MGYQPTDLTAVKVLADSMWLPIVVTQEELRRIDYTARQMRITTFELTVPRCVLAEFNTHCQLARNSASSRAIPVEKMIARVMENPFVPLQFSKNQKGMQASEFWVPGDDEYEAAAYIWLEARDRAVQQVKELVHWGVHKQDANRLLEPFMWHTIIATATWEHWDWPNFIRLRASDQADPKISAVAYMLRDAAEKSIPVDRSEPGPNWHLPLIGFPGDDELTIPELVKVSTARCARVSYLTHDGVRDVQADLDLFERLKGNGHYSPFEHAARPSEGRTAKFTGWKSARWYVEQGLDPGQ